MNRHELLLDEYRVELPKNSSISSPIAYSLGLFLLIAPFIPRLAVPMVLFSLSYFFLIFISLSIWDLSLYFRRRFIFVQQLVEKSSEDFSYLLSYYLEVFILSTKKAFAF